MALSAVFFMITSGFVASACLYHADVLVRGQPVSFAMQPMRLRDLLGSLFFCMFAGPYMLAGQGLRLWWSGDIPSPLYLASLAIVVLWSFCAGVFVAQSMTALGVI